MFISFFLSSIHAVIIDILLIATDQNHFGYDHHQYHSQNY